MPLSFKYQEGGAFGQTTAEVLTPMSVEQKRHLYDTSLPVTNPITGERTTWGNLKEYYDNPLNKESITNYYRRTYGVQPNQDYMNKHLNQVFDKGLNEYKRISAQNPSVALVNPESILKTEVPTEIKTVVGERADIPLSLKEEASTMLGVQFDDRSTDVNTRYSSPGRKTYKKTTPSLVSTPTILSSK